MAETKKYLDQTGLQMVLSKLTNKYDQRFLGLHAVADEAAKTTHKLTINVGDEEARVFDGSTDYEIDVAAAEHRHPASEIDFSHSGMSNVATVDQALDVLIKNVQIASGVLSTTTANMDTLKNALDKEVTDREAAVKAEKEARELADTGLSTRIKTLEDLLSGSGNVNEAIAAVIERLATEEKRSAAKDKEHDEAIADHKSRLETIEGEIGVEGSIKNAVNVEKLRAEAKELELSQAIATEKGRAEAAEKDLADDLADEVTNRTNADNGLSERITTNKNSIDLLNNNKDTQGSVAYAVDQAEARVKVVTDALDGRVSANEAAIDKINGTGEGSIKKAVADLVDGAPETLDTLNELAAALRDDADVLTAIENAFDTKLSTEKQAREAKDTAHEKRMTDIETAAAQEVQDRKDAVSGEATVRQQADEALSGRISIIEGIVKGDEGTTLKDIMEDIAENKKAIEDEAKTRAEEDGKLQSAIDLINGDKNTDGSFKYAIDQFAQQQDARDDAQDTRMDGIDTAIGTQGEVVEGTQQVGTGLHGRIDQEIATRTSEDARLEGRIAQIEGLIGDGEGSTTLKDLNKRLTQAEKDIDANEKAIAENAAAIAAIVALDEVDIDAAFNAVFQ